MKRYSKRVPRKQYNIVFICLIALSVVSAYLGLDLAADSVRANSEMLSPLSDATVIEVDKIVEKPVEVQTINTDILDLVKYIHQAESTSGKNANPQALHNYCKSQGKSNEYGYGGMALKICFENETMARARVTLWLAEHLEKYNGSVARTLCQYNTGTSSNDCPYYQNYVN